MNRRFSSVLLALLLTLSLSACGGELESGFIPEASNDAIMAVIPEGGPPSSDQQTPDESQNLPGGYQDSESGNRSDGKTSVGNDTLDEEGWYSSKEEVALYLHLYGELPGNYVTKDEAEAAGWKGGNVERYTGEGTAIGGTRFGNREGLLPKEPGRTYAECDIDTVGENSRGAKRIVFSNDGLIYYTDDHYESFELLYGEP